MSLPHSQTLTYTSVCCTVGTPRSHTSEVRFEYDGQEQRVLQGIIMGLEQCEGIQISLESTHDVDQVRVI